MSDIILRCQGLKKAYSHPAGDVSVLNGITFDLHQGERVAILGRSGTGKSTFLQVLGTLDAPTEGIVSYRDEEVHRYNDQALAEFRNRHLGFVFQFHYLLPEFTALENVMMPAWIARQTGSATEGRAKELLEVVGLAHRLQHRPMELSGGEQQRVSLARALMMKPDVVLTDEVTGNLDSKTGEEVLGYLRQINELYGVSVLSVTHQRDMAERFYSTLYTMIDGTLRPGVVT